MEILFRLQICAFVLLYSAEISFGLFELCSNSYDLSEINRFYYMYSPFYPLNYPRGTSCSYTLNAPPGFEILVDCELSIPSGGGSCTTDFFFISRNGDQSLSGAEQICGRGKISRTSQFNKLFLAYHSTLASPGGRFQCKITLRRQACDCGWSSKSRIVGGTAAHKYEYPSAVSLRYSLTKRHVCGASIINRRYVITAAHCTVYLDSPETTLIYAGYYEKNGTSDFRKVYQAVEFINYPGYNNTDNDIALIKTNTSMEWSSYIGPICIPLDQKYNSFDKSLVQIVGWGTTSFAGPLSKTLQSATVEVVPRYECLPAELCTNSSSGKDACQHDSGGPVILQGSLRQYLVGIIAKGNGCATDLGVNTRTTSYLEWIVKETNGFLCYKPLIFTQS